MLNQVLENNMCAGCGLCQDVFGTEKLMVELDRKGFYRPRILHELSTEEQKKLVKFCPGLTVKKERIRTPLYDSIWGEMISCLIGASGDPLTRNEASSGGGISSLLIYLLEKKSVDAVIHIGANSKLPHLNEVKISVTREQVITNANSRYSASAPLTEIHNIIKNSRYRHFAFVGKPCDIAALRQYSKLDPLINEKIKYFITFFCAGVPSVNATLDIVESMACNIENVEKIDYRKDGWPGYFKITQSNGNLHKLSYSLTWMNLLGPKMQFRCKVCPDGVGHFADIVCADGWDNFNERGFPTFKDAPGKSLIISRTEKGEKLLSEAINEGYILKLEEIKDFRKIDKMQPGQMSKKSFHLVRKLALFLKTGFLLRSNTSFYWKATFNRGLLPQIKNFWGTLKRVKKQGVNL